MKLLRITIIGLSCLMASCCCEEDKPAVPPAPVSLSRTIGERMVSAFKFYKEDGVPCDQIANQVEGIDLTKEVTEVVLKKGTQLVQWTYLDTANTAHRGQPIIGHYCTLPGSDSSKLGIPLKGRVKTILELTSDTKFLRSTASDIKDWKGSGQIFTGGGVQLFQENFSYQIKK